MGRQTLGGTVARFDRYLLSQLLVLFGFFSLVFVSVYWVNRAVVLFDRLIADGHSAGIFLEFTALSLPKVIGQILPMASFAAAVYVTNRLSSESELTVMQATGFSPWRLARPVAVFGLIVAGMMAILTHYLIPASSLQLTQREAEISNSLTAKLLREGTFLHPSRGVTFYIRDIAPDGELTDVYLSDRRNPDRPVTYTAENAYLVRQGETGARLVMIDGVAQSLNENAQTLSTTNFTDFSYDISSIIKQTKRKRPRIDEMSTLELISDPEGAGKVAKRSMARVLEELHQRFHQPLLCAVAAMIGFATLLVGGFSRFGVGRQIIGAIFLLVVIKMVESAVAGPLRSNASLWPLVYAPAFVGVVISAFLLWWASHPFALRPRHKGEAT